MTKEKVIVAAVVAVLAAFTGISQAQEINLNIEEYTLPNGLRVALAHDESFPTVILDLCYGVGNESYFGKTGIAHLAEHLMFKGTKHYPNFNDTFMKRVPSNNAHTTFDTTCYHEKFTQEHLEYVLAVESDRMINQDVSEEELEKEKKVVLNEMWGKQKEVLAQVHSEARRTLLLPINPYSWPIIGSELDVRTTSLEELHRFWKMYYTPNNATLAIAGNFDRVEARKLIMKYFAGIEPGKKLPPYLASTNFGQNHMVGNITMGHMRAIHNTIFVMWIMPAYADGGKPALDVLANILGRGRASRLFRLVDQDMFGEVNAYQKSYKHSGELVITAKMNPTLDVDEVEDAIMTELAEIVENGVTEDELQRAKISQDNSLLYQQKDLKGIIGKMSTYMWNFGKADAFHEDRERYRNITREDVQEIAKNLLVFSPRVVIEVVPAKKVDEKAQEEAEAEDDSATQANLDESADNLHALPMNVDRKQLPPLGKKAQYKLPVSECGQLENGVRLCVIENHRLPIVNAALVFPVGTSAAPPRIAEAAIHMLVEGTATRDSVAIWRDVGNLGADLGIEVRDDYFTMTFGSVKQRLAAITEIVHDLVTNATFPEGSVEYIKDMGRANLLETLKLPEKKVGQLAVKWVYGEHPYGRHLTKTDVEAFSRDAVVEFFDNHIGPSELTIVAAGDITLVEAQTLFHPTFGSWQKQTKKAPVFKQPTVKRGAQIFFAHKDIEKQASVAFMRLGVACSNPDLTQVKTVDSALFTGLTSRFHKVLRLQQGETYGVAGGHAPKLYPGIFFVETSVETGYAVDTVEEILKTFSDLAESEPLTIAELEVAKRREIDAINDQFSNSEKTLEMLASTFELQRANHRWIDQRKAVEEMTLADAHKMIRKYFQQDHWAIVVVGDKAVLEEDIRAFAEQRGFGFQMVE